MLLALLVGVVRVALGLLRAGVIAHLMSEPMLMGFVPAGAVLIIASQIPPALGTEASGGTVLAAAARALSHPGGWSGEAAAFAAGSLALIVGGRRLHRFFPGVPLALVAGLALAAGLGYGGGTVGHVPAGTPPLSLDLPYGSLPDLLVPGVVIAIVGFAEPASIARTFATRERQAWDPDRELLSQGAANLVAGVSGGYPAGGSLSRTSLNHMAGAATRLSGAVTGLVVLAFLPVASVLESLPTAVLAGIVIPTVLGLLRFARIAALWRVSRPQFAVAAATFALTLALAPHIERAVIAGVVLSIGIHLARELKLRLEVQERDGVLVVRPAGVLWFATAADLQERLIELLDAQPGAERVRLELDGLGRIDLTGLMTLSMVLDDVRDGGTSIEITGVPSHAAGLLDRYARGRSAIG